MENNKNGSSETVAVISEICAYPTSEACACIRELVADYTAETSRKASMHWMDHDLMVEALWLDCIL